MIGAAVARYARRFHALLADGHSVASPLGAWLLLALVAPVTTGVERERLTEVLGVDVETAFAAARRLLRDPHPELAVGSAIWHDARYETPALLEFVRRLVPPADAGPMPSQAEADAWARDRTIGLIDDFPLEIHNERGSIVLLLATALATKVSWDVPFEAVPPASTQLLAAPGFDGISLLVPAVSPAWQGFVDSGAGPVAAFAARSRDGLIVVSAVGEGTPAVLLDTAQSIATQLGRGDSPPRLPLAAVPLGDGPAWRITETVQLTGGPEQYECLLPAWEARTEHALLTHPDLGFGAAGNALLRLLTPGDYELEAKQSAVARYSAVGFEAAAVTALAGRAVSMQLPAERLVRTARIEFTRPHAVVAATEGGGEWSGLPVFAAWVSAAMPAG